MHPAIHQLELGNAKLPNEICRILAIPDADPVSQEGHPGFSYHFENIF